MAQLIFPIVADGLCVDVYVNLDAATLVPRRLSGQSGPQPIRARGLIDTASDITMVAEAIIQQLQAPRIYQTTTTGIGGSVPVNLHSVSLHILNYQTTPTFWYSHPTLVVGALAPGLAFDVLIGLDIIRKCKMHVDGPADWFMLEF